MSSVIVAGARTPMGRFNGALASVSATELGGVAIRGALGAAGLTGSDVDYVIMGQVLQAGVGQIPARQAAVAGGIAMDVPAVTINKVCLSGLDAIALADQLIRAGEFKIVVAGGMESMTRAPHLLPGSRAGFKYGDVDHDRPPGPRRPARRVHRRAHGRADRDDQRPGLRSPARSRTRSPPARTSGPPPPSPPGVFKAEIEPVVVPGRKGDVVVDTDEGIRADTTVESLAKLRPAFRKDGTITAGSSSQISDGAAAVIVMDKDEAERRGLDWIAEIKRPRVDRRAGLHPAGQARPGHQEGLRQGRHRPGRAGPGRDQRGVRLRRHRLDPCARARTRRS